MSKENLEPWRIALATTKKRNNTKKNNNSMNENNGSYESLETNRRTRPRMAKGGKTRLNYK